MKKKCTLGKTNRTLRKQKCQWRNQPVSRYSKATSIYRIANWSGWQGQGISPQMRRNWLPYFQNHPVDGQTVGQSFFIKLTQIFWGMEFCLICCTSRIFLPVILFFLSGLPSHQASTVALGLTKSGSCSSTLSPLNAKETHDVLGHASRGILPSNHVPPCQSTVFALPSWSLSFFSMPSAYSSWVASVRDSSLSIFCIPSSDLWWLFKMISHPNLITD